MEKLPLTKKFLNFLNRSTLIWVLILLVIVLASNFIFEQLHFRIDGTSDRSYSFSKGTYSLLENLPKEVVIRFYHSKSNPDAPIGIKNFGNRIEYTLREYSSIAASKVNLIIIDPKQDSDEEQEAIQSGIAPNNIGTSNYFLGAVISVGQYDEVIGTFDPTRENFLEYDLSRTIYGLIEPKKNKVAILSSLQLIGMEPSKYNGGVSEAYWVSELKKNFEVSILDYTTTTKIPEDTDLLIVYHPKDISLHVEYAIDQFLMQGKRIAILFDSYMRSDPLVEESIARQQPYVSSSLPQRFFDKWNIIYESQKILGDRDFAAVVPTSAGQIPYALWFSGTQESLNKSSPITAGINNLLFVEPSAFDLDASSDLNLTPLVRFSDNFGFVPALAVAYLDLNRVNSSLQESSHKRWYLGGILDGTFESSFSAKPELDEESQKNEQLVTEFTNLKAHIKKTSYPSRVLLMADSDFISTPVVVERLQFFNQVIFQPKNDNISFFLAALYDLQGSKELAAIKPKNTGNRPFELFLSLQRSAQSKYIETEKVLQAKLSDLENNIKILEPKQGESTINLPPETLEKIKTFRLAESQARKDLREIRKFLREDIEFLSNILIFINLFLIPAIMTMIGIRIYLKRTRNNITS